MIRASLDKSNLESKLKRLQRDLNMTSDETVTQMARLGGKQLAIRVEPYGIGTKSKDISQKAILKDINQAYDYIGQTYNALRKINPSIANAFSRAVNNNDYAAAEKYARKYLVGFKMENIDTGTHLDSVRNNRGRVPKSAPVMGIANSNAIEVIKKQKINNAGLVKAGWLHAAKSIGSLFRIPVWLRKSKSLGRSLKRKTKDSVEVTLFNDVDYASQLTTESKKNAAIKNAYQNQVRFMTKKLQADVNKFNI